MRNSFLYHTQLHAENFTPAFVLGGDFWRLYLDEDCLGGCRELAVYSSKQAPPRLEKTEDTVRWIYDTIKAKDGSVHNIRLTLTATLADGVWQYAATMENNSRCRINELQYPLYTVQAFNGALADDVLYAPETLGSRIPDPHGWTKQSHTEYKHGDNVNVIHAFRYPGQLSMPWMVMESGGQSLYLGVHSDVWRKFSFVMETEPRQAAEEYFILGVCSYPAVLPGECLTYDGFTAALFDGDWREGADFYRAWADRSWLAPMKKKENICHLHGWQRIICRSQYGDIYYTYRDLPRVYREGVPYGLTMLLVFGWWQEGMDNGYPNYQPDEALGGWEALQAAIAEIQAMGGRVILYANGHLIDRATDYYKEEGHRYTAKTIEGDEYIEWYGFSETGTMLRMGHKTFTMACFGAQEWCDKVEQIEKRHLDLGSDGTFFDQMGCNFYLCFDKSHSHGNRVDEEPALRLACVKRLKANLNDDQWLGIECVGDRLMPYVDFSHGVGKGTEYRPDAYPYLFRYTFPEVPITNRYIHDMKEGWEKHLSYAFVHGFLFDVAIYRCRADLREMPAYGQKIKEYIDLRKTYQDYFTKGTFDMLSLPDRVWGATYTYNGKTIAAVWNDADDDFIMNGTVVAPGGVAVLNIEREETL